MHIETVGICERRRGDPLAIHDDACGLQSIVNVLRDELTEVDLLGADAARVRRAQLGALEVAHGASIEQMRFGSEAVLHHGACLGRRNILLALDELQMTGPLEERRGRRSDPRDLSHQGTRVFRDLPQAPGDRRGREPQ